jgi:hypothetical protein
MTRRPLSSCPDSFCPRNACRCDYRHLGSDAVKQDAHLSDQLLRRLGGATTALRPSSISTRKSPIQCASP